MQTSQTITEISKALALAQAELKNPECNETVRVEMKGGGSYSYRYATLAKCYDVTRKVLAKHGFSHTSTICGGVLSVRLLHSSGEWLQSSMELSKGLASKDLAGSVTFWKRYLFNGLVGITGDEDAAEQDGDRSTPANKATPLPKGNAPASKPGPKPNPPKEADPGDFVLHLGTLADKKIKDCDIGDLQKAREFLKGQAPERMGDKDKAALTALTAFFDRLGRV